MSDARTERPAAVAGSFYPADPAQLRAAIDGYLREAEARNPRVGPRPKAFIVPHAGYMYSAPVAASAYAALASWKGEARRVVLVGPSHRVAFRGVAFPTVDAFRTPLGCVRIDRAAALALRGAPGFVERDDAHADEHSLEVNLPFIQCVLGDVLVVPLVVGAVDPHVVAGLLSRLWDEGTVFLVSSDLSHYLPYDEARAADAVTTEHIVALEGRLLGPEDACGFIAVRAMLELARERDLRATALDVRSSGDTQERRDRVVGYGAYAFA